MSKPTNQKEPSTKQVERAFEFKFEPITVSKNGWRVTLSYEDEGYYGKYAPIKEANNMGFTDDPCLRMTIYERIEGKWVQIPFGSSLVYLRPNDPQDVIINAAKILVNECINNPNKPFDRFFINKLATIHLCKGEARLLPDFGSPVSDDD